MKPTPLHLILMQETHVDVALARLNYERTASEDGLFADLKWHELPGFTKRFFMVEAHDAAVRAPR